MPKAVFVLLSCILLLPLGIAQEAAPAPRVPSLIKHSGVLKDRMGRAMRDIVGLTFLIYKDREGGTPLWMETQNVNPEADGSYSASLGATKALPLELFLSGETRWLSVQVNLPGEDEQPRVQLVSVPFALKAADAETLGGKPLSAFVLAPDAARSALAADPQPGGQAITTVLPTAAVTTANYIAKFLDGSGTTGNSAIYQNGSNVGIGTTGAEYALDVWGEARAVAGLHVGYWPAGFSSYANVRVDMSTKAFLWAYNNVPTTTNFVVSSGDSSIGFFGDGNDKMHFYGAPASTNESFATFTANRAKVTFDLPNGRVGIGASAPVEKLEVVGNVKITGTPNVNYIQFPDGSKQYAACNIQFGAQPLTAAKEGVRALDAQGCSGILFDLAARGLSVTDKHPVALAQAVEVSLLLEDAAGSGSSLSLSRQQPVEAGDVLAISATVGRKVDKAAEPYSMRVAGVFTGSGERSSLAVAGLAFCKVSAENGPIVPGDLLVTSSLSGHAMKGTDRGRMLGAVVGKALEPLAAGTGIIQVLVILQ